MRLMPQRAEKIWNFRAAGEVESSPAVNHGIVYVGSYSGNVYALNASTRKKLGVLKPFALLTLVLQISLL